MVWILPKHCCFALSSGFHPSGFNHFPSMLRKCLQLKDSGERVNPGYSYWAWLFFACIYFVANQNACESLLHLTSSFAGRAAAEGRGERYPGAVLRRSTTPSTDEESRFENNGAGLGSHPCRHFRLSIGWHGHSEGTTARGGMVILSQSISQYS